MQRKTKIKIFIVFIFIIGFYLMCLVFWELKSNKFYYYLKFDSKRLSKPENLVELREIFKNDLANKNEKYAFKLLHKRLRILNSTGICYFNVIIQALVADTVFLESIIMNDFPKDAIVLRILQILFCKLFTRDFANFYEEHDFLREISYDKSIFSRNCGLSEDVLHFLNVFIDYELKKYNLIYLRKKILNFVNFNITYRCNSCNSEIISKFDALLFYSFEKGFKDKLTVYDLLGPKIINLKHFCGFFRRKTYDLNVNVQMPNTLVFQNPYRFTYDFRFTHNLGFPKKDIVVCNDKYTLFAAIINFKCGNFPHAAIFLKKGDKMFYSSDSQYYDIKNMLSDSHVSKYSRFFFYERVVTED